MISKKLVRIRSPLVTNSFYLYLSHFADYLFALFILPFISRTLGAEELGKIGLAQTFGILMILFVEFGFSLMATRQIAREKENQNKINFFVSQIITYKIYLIPLTLLISTIFILFVPTFYYNPHYIIIISIGAIFQGFAPSWYFQGIEKMRRIALSKMGFRFFGFIMILLFVRSPSDGWIILLSNSLSSALICLYLFQEMTKRIGRISIVKPSQAIIVFNKSKYSFLITIIPVIYQNISMITLSLFVNPIQLGFYYGASRVYRAFNTLYSPISQAFFPIISSLDNKNESILLIRKYLFLTTIIGLFFFLINFLFAEQIIKVLLGNEFSGSSNLLRIFSIVLPLTAISNALGRQWLMVINKDYYYSINQLISSLIAFIAFIYFIRIYGTASLPISLIFYESSSIILILVFALKNKKFI